MVHLRSNMPLFVTVLVFLLVASSVSEAAGEDPRGPGDVLHPGKPSQIKIYVGLEGGMTYSMFSGTFVFVTNNPFQPQRQTSLWAPFDGGSGLGFMFGGNIDIAFTEQIGLMAKLYYNTRRGVFNKNFDFPNFYVDPNTGYPASANTDNELDWTLEYISFDLLLRYQVTPQALYIFGGLSYSSMSTNTADFTQTIVRPEDIEYIDDNGFMTGERQAQTSGTVKPARQGEDFLSDSRVAVKLGAGWWIKVSDKVFLTPEISAGIPVSSFFKATGNANLQVPDSEMNYITLFATLGLKFEL